LDMPRVTQIPFSSRNIGEPAQESGAAFWGLVTRIILEASSSDTRNAAGRTWNTECSHYFILRVFAAICWLQNQPRNQIIK
jgi:hypothetical protein